jgi:hypothetical protein
MRERTGSMVHKEKLGFKKIWSLSERERERERDVSTKGKKAHLYLCMTESNEPGC